MAGAWSRFTTWLLGKRPERLKEAEGHSSFIAYLIIFVQSAAMLLVAGRVEIQFVLGNQPLALKVISGILLALLLFTVWAADITAIKSFLRIWSLLRNRQGTMAFMHVLYVAFVFAVEALTLGIVIYTADSDPQAFVRVKPLIPTTSRLFLALVLGRVLIATWTALQAQIVRQAIEPGMPALLTPVKEHLGGKAKAAIAALQIAEDDIPALLDAYAHATRPMPRKRTFLNSWIIKYEEEHQAKEDAHRENLRDALDRVTHNRIDELTQQHAQEIQTLRAEAHQSITTLQEKLARTMEEAQRMAQQAEETAQRTIERELEQMRATFVRGLLHLSLNKELPYDIAVSFPEVAGLSFSRVGGAHNDTRREPKEPVTGKDKAKVWLADKDIAWVPTPDRKRGVWLTSTEAMKLVKEGVSRDDVREVITHKNVGDGLKQGLAYIGPFDKLMDALSGRNWLNKDAALFWTTYSEGREKAGANERDNDLYSDDDSAAKVVNFR